MRRFIIVLISFFFIGLILSTCDTVDPEPPTLTYELVVNVSPDNNAGLVTPENGTYNENEDVTLRATATEGWQFENWSGSGVSSSENPYQITMISNRTIIANFSRVGEAETFIADMDISDGVYTKSLKLVSDDNGSAQSSLDQNDVEGPPIAPPGAFFVGSVVDNMNLYKDVRPTADKIVWTVRLYRESDKTVTLNNFSVSKELKGSLMLVDDPDDATPNIEINMQSSSGYSVSDPSIQYLYVIYEAQESAKMIAGDFESGVEIEEGKDDINGTLGSTDKGSNSNNKFRNE
jgi:hypothetical protein